MRAVQVERLQPDHASRISIAHVKFRDAIARDIANGRAPRSADRPNKRTDVAELTKAPLADGWRTRPLRERGGKRAVCGAPEGERIDRAVTREVVQEDPGVGGGVNLGDQRRTSTQWSVVEAQVRGAPFRLRDKLSDEDLFNPVVGRVGCKEAERGAAIKSCVVLKSRDGIFEHATGVRGLNQRDAAVALLTKVNHRRLALCGGARHDTAQECL